MIVHKAESMKKICKSFCALLQQKRKPLTVSFGKENFIPAIASQENMIDSTGYMNAMFSGHSSL